MIYLAPAYFCTSSIIVHSGPIGSSIIMVLAYLKSSINTLGNINVWLKEPVNKEP